MNIFNFLKAKFNPNRPMGRKNWFWTTLVWLIIFLPITWALPGIEVHPPPPNIVIAISAMSLLPLLLNLRRARAAEIPLILVYMCWLCTPINLIWEGGPLEGIVNAYQVFLFIYFLSMKNKVEPLSP